MSKSQRIKIFFEGLLRIPLAVFMAFSPEDGYLLIMAALSLNLIFSGLRALFGYFTMTRFMIGGKMSLYVGIIILDLGLFTASISDIPRFYIMFYLLCLHLFSGLIDLIAALDSKRLGAVHWKLKFSQGLIGVLIAAVCLTFISTKNTVVYIYCIGMLYNAAIKIITSFRRTAMVYIQ